ncbi:MAG TPA: ABC transporter ATP-binding protein [Kiritimatiellia bacterium]|nr:ABC transporter ATP-binding protein [Kiritimatiellia bacterium]HMO97662.1 ABC transporter ATP-binding protein [Kiritimatiellia bacterium]HMP95523.1 ABC transporter ATP-binding protein [Kiritimatiellia bacterium]
MNDALLEVEKLSIGFGTDTGELEVVSRVDLHVGRGEVVALVGESGSGKTVTALAVTRLLPMPPARIRSGSIRFQGVDVLTLPERALRSLRGGKIGYIFQEPATALNPVFTAGFQIAEALRRHGVGGAADRRVGELLEAVGLSDHRRIASSYPHQLSGGQQQRVLVAIALAGDPELLIADEPTTALDVTVQAQILDLLAALRKSRGMAVLLITHNLAIAARLADRLCVMYAGEVVETGPVREVMAAPRHPYTAALLEAVPRLRGATRRLAGIPGSIPAGGVWPEGCRFHPRCRLADERCRRQAPPCEQTGNRTSRCHYPEKAGYEPSRG